MTDNSLQERDYRHLWHPYTDQERFEQGPYVCIEWAEGPYLYDTTGRAILDGISSWWCVAMGHGHPHIVEAIQEQAGCLQHSILGGLSHVRAAELAERLAALTPGDLNRCYFAADGSSVVDAALKIAVQYWQLRDRHGKTRFISLEHAYHGDTIGAMGVGYLDWFRGPYGAIVTPALQAPSPSCVCCDHLGWAEDHCAKKALDTMEALLEDRHEEVAAVMVEPMCQAAAGIRFYPAAYLSGLRALCDRFEVLLIADEIATGFGRTGRYFACDHANVVPDMMCLGKALTGGYLPLSALVVRDEIFDAFRTGPPAQRVLWDGHTFCGNPITAAAAIAALEVYERAEIPQSVAPRMAQLKSAFAELAKCESVVYARTLGMIGMCELSPGAGGAELARTVCARALEAGLFIRPLGAVLYLWPALNWDEESLCTAMRILEESLAASRMLH